MTTTTIFNLPLTHQFNTGTLTSSVGAVPAGFQNLVLTMSPTTGAPATPFQGVAHPFNSPTQSVTFGIKWSWDAGVTFPDSVERTEVGSSTGTWSAAHGTTTMAPTCTLGIVWDSVAAGIPAGDPNQALDPLGFPTHYQAYLTVVNGPINSGLLVQEVKA